MSHLDLRKSLQKKGWVRLLFVLLVGALLFALASGSRLRIDLSENQTSSLSPSTIALLHSLDEPVQIKAYFTSDLPQPYGQLQQFILDKLVSYRDEGEGNVGFEVVDPADDANIEASLTALNIPKVQVQVIEDDRAQVRQGYLAIVVEYLDKQEVLPVIQTDTGFEYMLTRKIKKISGKGKSTIALATGFGASGLDELQVLQQLLQGDYELVEVDLNQSAVPAGVKALIVDGVDKAPSEAFRYHLDQFRMRGGGVFVLASNVEPQLQQGFVVMPTDSYANNWLQQDLRVAVEPGLVMDKQASRITVNQQQGGFSFRSVVDFPFIANVVDMHPDALITKGLESVSMPFAAPLLWLDEGADNMVLMRSSLWSSVQSGPPFDVDPLVPMQQRFAGMSLRPSALMLLGQGRMSSAFEAVPEGMQGSAEMPHQSETDDGRLLISASSALLDNEFIEGNNSVLILNMMDWLCRDEALIELRSVGDMQRPLEPLNSGERTFFKIIWIFFAPALLLLFAGWRWYMLRQRSR